MLSASLAMLVMATSAWAQASPIVPPVSGAVDKAGVLNLNNATEDQLELLPGIGPQKAKAIVEHRHAHPFHKTDELMKVKGIGRKTFGRLRPYLTLVGPSTLAHEVKLRR